MNPLDVQPDNIWLYAQNKPSLIMADLEQIAQVPRQVTAKILMARGVFKWLSVRRSLIRLKNEWRDELTKLYRAIEQGDIKRGTKEHYQAQGRMTALQDCRAQVRALCHSERWVIPDNDLKAEKWLMPPSPEETQ